MVVLALVAALGVCATAGAGTGGAGGGDQTYGGGGGLDGCGSEAVGVGDPNYDGACDYPETLDSVGEYAKTIDGAASRCRRVEERITYRAAIARTMIWQYVQQIEWCWRGGIIRTVNRIRFPRLSFAGSIYWDFKGHIASSCASWSDYSTCSELAGRATAYIATQGKFQSFSCGVKLFCITKAPGMWARINGSGKVLDYGTL